MTEETVPTNTGDQKDDVISLARRKAISGLFPFAVNAFAQARQLVSPTNMAERAVQQAEGLINARMNSYQSLLKQSLPRLSDQSITLEGESAFSFVLTREQALEGLIEDYVKQFCAEERWFDFPFAVMPRRESPDLGTFDAYLSLPRGRVNVKMLAAKPEILLLPQLQDNTLKNGSSEIWIFVTSGLSEAREQELLLDPSFQGYRHFLPGRILVFGLNNVVSRWLRNQNYSVKTSALDDGKIKISVSEAS
ncbi:MAG: hypothetical protein JRN20_18920 [Nitrososphaerota archaeon]|jgi:hypothetical protein|nr:hypothetical protein [Nitrososphaerota archaeon]MDG6922927.1 hypothetical protein [Nitrososphaerota archaeon]